MDEAKNQAVSKLPPYIKLQEAIKGFADSLPLIQQLSDPSVVERHWKRIIDETGKDIGEINLKTFTLQKVFELELQNHEENIKEICKEAKEEKKNDEIINKIEDAWKGLMFEVFPHINKVTGVEKGKAIKSPDDVKDYIEQHTLQLQVVGSSKYARSMLARVKYWENNINTVSDVIDIWLKVQRSWIYLESIFSNEDIKVQLQEESKNFMKVNT